MHGARGVVVGRGRIIAAARIPQPPPPPPTNTSAKVAATTSTPLERPANSLPSGSAVVSL
jgi:hypothetical protein